MVAMTPNRPPSLLSHSHKQVGWMAGWLEALVVVMPLSLSPTHDQVGWTDAWLAGGGGGDALLLGHLLLSFSLPFSSHVM